MFIDVVGAVMATCNRAPKLRSFEVAAQSWRSNRCDVSTADDRSDVDHLIAAYDQAVMSHDAPRLEALLAPTGTAWFSVLSDDGLKRAHAKSPDAAKLKSSNVESFVKLVASSKSRFDPRHSNLQIRSDGTIATVMFDFSFLMDDKEQNAEARVGNWQRMRMVGGSSPSSTPRTHQ